MNLGIAVNAGALVKLHEGVTPEVDQAKELAEDFVATQPWAEISANVATPFLTSVASGKGQLLEGVPLGDIGEAAFALGGWFLSAFLPEGKDWTDFLDEILAQLEATPEPQ